MKRLALATTVLIFLLAPAGALAVTIVATFTGTLTSVEAPLTFLMPGDAFSVVVSYESDGLDADPDPEIGDYPANAVTFQVGSHLYGVGPGIRIVDSDSDAFDVPGPGSGPTVDGFLLDFFELILVDSTASAFTDDSLPVTLSLDDFDTRRIVMTFVSESAASGVEGVVTTISVPEPAAGTILVAGLLGIGLAARSRTR